MPRQRWGRWLAAAASVVALAVSASIVARLSRPAMRLQPLTPAEQEVKDAVRRLWQQEDDAAAAGDQQALDAVFDLSTTDGQEAVRHAEARLAFVQAWAQARGVTWRPPAVSVRTPRIRFGGGSPPATVDVTAVVSESWTYVYNGTGQAQAFGLGRELDQDTRTPGPAVPSPAGPLSPTSGTASGGVAPANAAIANVGKTAGYDRAGAVAYADRYCGAAPGCGNGGW